MLQQKFTARNYESVARNWNDPPKKNNNNKKQTKKPVTLLNMVNIQ